VDARRQLIAIARRRARPGIGSSRELLMRRSWTEPRFELRRLSTPYVIVGAVAASLYMAERLTRDVGILVRASDAGRVETELAALGHTRMGALAIGGSAWMASDGGELAVLYSAAIWVDDAVAHPNWSPSKLPVIALPYLVLLKLESSRGIDVGDLQRMLGGADEATLNGVREVVATYRPDDVEDLESLIALGKLEYEA
jgi:hypothetical protein